MPITPTPKQLAAENAQLRARLKEAEETLRAIRHGEVDALVMLGTQGDHIHTLEGAQEPYRVMVEAMGEGAVTVTEDGSILYCNSRFAERVKVPLEQVVGLPLQGMIAEHDRKRFEAILVQAAQREIREALMLQETDGTRLPALFSLSPLPQSDGKIISVIIADLSDVLAASEARSRLALIVDSSDDAIVSTDLNGVVESWNRAAEELFGYTTEEALGHTIDSLIVPPEQVNEVIQEIEAIRRGELTLLLDTVRLRKDRARVEVSIKASPILDDAGKVVGASINSRDITERKRIQAERDRATYLLAQRLKELNCLHAISNIVAESGLSVEQRLQSVVDTIPSGFQYPEATCARITLQDSQHTSADFKETAWHLGSAIEREGEANGSLDIFYTQTWSASDEQPFLQEEGILVDTISRVIEDFLKLDLTLSQLNLFRDLVEQSNDAVFVIDPEDAHILDVNKEACSSLGYSRDELLAMYITDIDVTLSDGFAWKDIVEKIKKSVAMRVYGRNRRKDGSSFPIDVSVKYVALNERSYMIAIARDAAERWLVDEALSASEKRFLTLFEQSAIGLSILSPQGKWLEVNDKFCEILGYSREELLQLDFRSITHPDHVEQDALRMQAFIAGERESDDWDKLYIRKDGAVIWAHLTIRLAWDVIGQPEYFVVVTEDITERKLSEDELAQHRQNLEKMVSARTTELAAAEARTRLILDSSADGLYGVDQQGVTTFINAMACQLLGYRPQEVLGHSSHEIFHHHHPDGTIFPESQCPINATLREGKTNRVNAATFWRADGQPLSVSFTSRPIQEGEQIIGAVISFFDNSTERAAKKAKMLALKEAEHLARIRSEFLANMSHEIRTPLNGVLGFAQVGQRDSEGRKSFETFGRIIDSGQLLLGIVNDILDFSKIDAGKLVLEQGTIDLASIIDHVTAIVRTSVEEKGLDLIIEIAPDLPARCSGDGLRLSQVLTNLLTNALKFTPRGRVSLTAARADNHLVFRVIDSGIGMQPEQIKRLFKPFEQGDSSTTRKFGGTGLGLVISKRLVDLMNGNISVHSEPDVGSTFEVRIPLLNAEGHIDCNYRPEPAFIPQLAEPRLDGLSLLVAEDNEVNRLVLEQMLTPEGCRLTLVEDGRKAVDAVRKSAATGFDLALMDIQMPELDGYAATREIHEIVPNLPVVALTAHAMMDEQERCLEAGMVAHVAKPVEVEALVSAILTALGHEVIAPAPPQISSSSLTTEEVTSGDVSIDWETLSSRYADKPRFFLILLTTIMTGCAERPAKIREAAVSARAGDFSDLLTLLHSLKGMAGHVLPDGIQRHVVELETLAKEGKADCPALAETLADEIDAIIQDIRAQLAEIDPAVEIQQATAGDWVRVAELVSQLEPLVGSSDAQSISLFEQERHLFDNVVGETASKLGRHLELFDFLSARADLIEIRTICQQQVKQK